MRFTSELEELTNQYKPLLAKVIEEDWDAKPNPEKWSKKEILGHLVDSALANLKRFTMTQYSPGHTVVYHQDEWVRIHKYQQAPASEILLLWELLNKQIGRTISSIPEDDYALKCDTGKYGSPEFHSLEFLIADYIRHLEYHLKQLA